MNQTQLNLFEKFCKLWVLLNKRHTTNFKIPELVFTDDTSNKVKVNKVCFSNHYLADSDVELVLAGELARCWLWNYSGDDQDYSLIWRNVMRILGYRPVATW